MTLTIEIPDNLKAALKAQANAQGLSEAGYIRAILERNLAANGRQAAQLSPEERVNAFETFVADFEGPAPLPDQAFQRENWYPDR